MGNSLSLFASYLSGGYLQLVIFSKLLKFIYTILTTLSTSDLPFGGITVAFGGDFQQTLPIIPRDTKEHIIGACLQRSMLRQKIRVLHLTENMRVDRNDPQSTRFAE